MSAIAEPTFAQYVQARPGGPRASIRAAALSTLAAAAQMSGRMARALRRPRVQFVYLHHVLIDEEQGFRRLLQDLSRLHTFTTYSDAVRRVQAGDIDRPYVCFSWDDGFRDNLRAARVLEEFGTRGCFFVCPGIVGEQSDQSLRAFCRNLDFPVLTPFLSWQDMEKLVADGHEVGGHTMTHPDLGALSPAAIGDEVARSREEIRKRLGKAQHFAWPRGRWINFSPAARDAVFAAGFISCASAVRGCHVTASGPSAAELCIRRDHIFANWPASHVRYLLMRNSVAASKADNAWPVEYSRVN
jgi:peptidoglycan/xylan/chitin deacetylase (PgdA/CDA1 family)